jgi:hypothetical protein
VLDVLGGVKAKVDGFLEAMLWAAVAAAAATAGGLFLLVALFIWLAARYDPLTACLVLGLLFVAVATGASIAFLLVRRRPDRAPVPAGRLDPAPTGAIATDLLAGLVAEASERGRETADAIRSTAGDAADALQETLERRPLTALGIVIGIGFLFGAKWRR